MKKYLVLTSLIILSACASSPDDLMASYVSPLQYQKYDCGQIEEEAGNVERRVSELYGTLDKKAGNDNAQMGVGLVLFWPALFFLEGGDGPEAAEYKRLKGEYDALEKASVQKKCHLKFNIQEAIPKKLPPKQTDEVQERLNGKKQK